MRLPFYSILVITALLGGCKSNDKSQEKMVDLKTTSQDPHVRIEQLTAAIEKDQKNATLLAHRAKLFLETKQADKALADAEKAILLDTTNGEYYFLKAKAQRALNRLEAALNTLTQAESNGFATSEVYVLRGEIFIIVKQYQKAIDNLNLALKLTPFNEYAYFYKGLVYAESGDTARAINSLQTAIEQEPQFIEPYNELAKIHTAQKNYREAAQYLQSGLRYAPSDPFLHYNQGVNLVGQRYPDSAAYSFRQALKADTAMYMARYNLGVVAYNQNKFAEAAEQFEQLLRHSSRLPNLQLLLADSYEKAGRREDALRVYNEVLEDAPANTYAQNAVRRLSRPRASQTDTTATRKQRN